MPQTTEQQRAMFGCTTADLTYLTAEVLNAHLLAGGRVQVTTYTRSTVYGRKHAGWFTTSGGALYVQHGRGRVCLSLTNGQPLVSIRRIA